MYNHEPAGYACPLCRFVEGHESDFNKIIDIVFQDETTLAYVSPKWWINNPGNVIIIPKKHVEHIYDVEDELLASIYKTGKSIAIAMKKTYGCDGTSFRQHNEPAGNQEIYHFHLHLFPRWKTDHFYQNFENYRYVNEQDRQSYAEKLRSNLKEPF
jgi:histidine triad (HIT) family protein